MNILVTGAKGFIGKNLIATLHNIADGKDKSFGIDGDITVLDTLKKYNNNCPIMISSSVQAALNNPYGELTCQLR